MANSGLKDHGLSLSREIKKTKPMKGVIVHEMLFPYEPLFLDLVGIGGVLSFDK